MRPPAVCLARVAILAALLCSGCVSQRLAPVGTAGDAAAPPELVAVPFFAQQEHQCGPAALATALVASGAAATPEALAGEVYLPGRQGSLQAELVAATRAHGRVPYVLDPRREAIVAEIAAGRPVLVLQNLGLGRWDRWHYAVVVGITRDRVVLRSGPRERLVMSARSFDRTWRAGGRWAFVVLRPGELPARPDAQRWLRTSAAFEETGRVELAREGYALATQHWPQESLAWTALGNAEYRLGRPAAAERAYRAAVVRGPADAAARNNLAQVLIERGCLLEAEQHLEAARAASPPELRAIIDRTAGELERRRAAHDGGPGCGATPPGPASTPLRCRTR